MFVIWHWDHLSHGNSIHHFKLPFNPMTDQSHHTDHWESPLTGLTPAPCRKLGTRLFEQAKNHTMGHFICSLTLLTSPMQTWATCAKNTYTAAQLELNHWDTMLPYDRQWIFSKCIPSFHGSVQEGQRCLIRKILMWYFRNSENWLIAFWFG